MTKHSNLSKSRLRTSFSIAPMMSHQPSINCPKTLVATPTALQLLPSGFSKLSASINLSSQHLHTTSLFPETNSLPHLLRDPGVATFGACWDLQWSTPGWRRLTLVCFLLGSSLALAFSRLALLQEPQLFSQKPPSKLMSHVPNSTPTPHMACCRACVFVSQ
jgi:hypothetical protein